jgi:CBS domain-containing protein
VREGLITLEDVQIVKYTHRFLNPLPSDKLVSEVMTHPVVSLTPATPVHQVWKILLEQRVKAAPVIDAERKVLGIITNEDLLERAGIQQRLSVAIRMDTAEVEQEIQVLKSSTLTAADVMTRPVITVPQSETLGTATEKMVKAGLKRLPVVDEHGRLTGMLSRLDILRQAADSPLLAQIAQLHPGMVRTVRDIMSANIPAVGQDDDLATMIEKFSQCDEHRLIVIDSDGKAVGLLSDSDIVARIQPQKRRGILSALRRVGKPPAGKETALELMSPGPLTCGPDLPVLEAARLMLAQSRKWLVVVDDQGKPLGLVDRRILLESLTVLQ